MKIHFITFANSDSNFSQERIIFEANNMDIFNDVTFYTEKDFDKEFIEKYGSHFRDYKRGYGYWSWKPYIIQQKLNKLQDGDVVVYADSGCMFQRKNRKTLEKWIDIAVNSNSGILSPCYGPYIEHDWTRGDLHEYIEKTYNKDNVDIFDKAIQCGAGILIVCKNDKSVEFIDNWLDVMTNHFHLCTDEKSLTPNHPNFKENRHDQSVFSMLSKIYGIETIETHKGILDKENSPIIATRCKNDKTTWNKPLEIVFDHQIYDLQNFGGISRMYCDLSNELNHNEIISNYTGNGAARGEYQKYFSKFLIKSTNNEYLKNEYNSPSTETNLEYSIDELKKGNFDIFYPTFFNPYFLKYIGDKPFIMSVHDMIPELYPQYFSKNDIQILGKKEMVKKASAIEVPTQCTKDDLVRILGVDENKIHVIGRALTPSFGEKFYDENPIGCDYILYVGQRNAYKRFDWFIKHIAPFLEKHKEIKIICTGKDFTEQEKKLFKKHKLLNRVNSMFADDVMMASLYKYAKFFVYSSEYEGFGLPVLESYKMGCIALLNDNKCFREVTLNKGEFFTLKEDESNLSDVAEKIISLSEDERKKIISEQNEILSKYSFDEYTNKFKKMIDMVYNKKNEVKDTRVDIFICTHKEFEPIVKNEAYKIINANDINNDKAENGLNGSFYSELMTYKYIAENFKLPKYVGFCSYRKYFSFLDDVPNMDEIFSNYDAITAKPKQFKGNIIAQYKSCHNIEDLYVIGGIIADKYPQYAKMWHTFINGKIFIPYNMFIMNSEDFIEYMKFMMDVLDEYVKIVGTDINKRIEDNKDKYLKSFYPNNTQEYQYRIGGYLGERLTNLFLLTHFKKIKTYSVIVTEDKYKQKQKG